jgi:hypothetical protein
MLICSVIGYILDYKFDFFYNIEVGILKFQILAPPLHVKDKYMITIQTERRVCDN